MPEIVVTEFMDEEALADLRRDYDVLYDPDLHAQPEALRQAVGDARALIVRNRTRVDPALLSAAGRLEVVGRLGVGLDNIDLEACRERGVAVCPATGANDQAVAEYVVAAALMLLRRCYHSSADVMAGHWPRQALIGREVAGKVLGLVGFGAIARETARRAQALGMVVAAFDPFVAPADAVALGVQRHESLEGLLRGADVVSLHVPLTRETRNLIDTRALAAMKPDAVLINTSRGGVVDEDALAEALRAGRLGGAALDVFEEEPLTAASAERFNGLENVVLTPHVAGVTRESNRRVGAVTAANVRRVLEGRT